MAKDEKETQIERWRKQKENPFLVHFNCVYSIRPIDGCRCVCVSAILALANARIREDGVRIVAISTWHSASPFELVSFSIRIR